MFESTSSISCVFVLDVKNSLSKQESKCLYTALSLSLYACSLINSFQKRSVSLANVAAATFRTCKLVYNVGLVLFTRYFVFGVRIKVFSLVVDTLVLTCKLVMLRQRNSFFLSARSSCSPLVPMYGISRQNVGLVLFISVVLLSMSFVAFCLNRFMSEETICLGDQFHDAIFLINCNSWVSFEGEQIVAIRHKRERIHAMRCFHGTKASCQNECIDL